MSHDFQHGCSTKTSEWHLWLSVSRDLKNTKMHALRTSMGNSDSHWSNNSSFMLYKSPSPLRRSIPNIIHENMRNRSKMDQEKPERNVKNQEVFPFLEKCVMPQVFGIRMAVDSKWAMLKVRPWLCLLLVSFQQRYQTASS